MVLPRAIYSFLVFFKITIPTIVYAQILEGKTFDFNSLSCTESNAFNIQVDSVRIPEIYYYEDYIGKERDHFLPYNTNTVYKVTCNLKSDSSTVNYRLFKVTCKKYKNDFVYVFNPKKGTLMIEFELDSVKSITVRDSFYIETYDFSKNNLNGKMYLKHNGLKEIYGKYENGFRVDEWIENHPSGSIMSKGSYIAKVVILEYNPETKEIVEIQNYKDTLGVFPSVDYSKIVKKYNIPWDPENTVRFPKRINLKNGEWFYYDKSRRLIRKEIYKDGIFEAMFEF